MLTSLLLVDTLYIIKCPGFLLLADWHLADFQVVTVPHEDSKLRRHHIVVTTALLVRRPIAGNINMCPETLWHARTVPEDVDHLGLNSWQAIITHELMHVMAS